MHVEAPDARQGAGQPTIPVELEAFFAVAEKWHLSTEEQIVLLGSPGRSTFFKWKKEGGTPPTDTRERVSHMLGIWKSLRILFTQDERGEAWVRAKNRYFDGASALDVMLEGMSGIIRVRRYLDAQRGA
ncbi:MbcA/ParS/Xre antitoxin family protein [Mesorhizobium sp. BR1-1-14]|uniref:MbcA/ParS/Xre antitoxin family protein n=1 Tax=Mesorhizobium sp. BR1-1-14 TaxID=2876655 RepID=UPI001CD0EE75|nr:MbcA/ParS/Xre antitoxin family protein [Mesorhizobium sp. BR1-1-14]MBZ9959300.1 MbcA/ParS/Xre antitoxin family protein [Mesorhizobium sp. BR1-1-14]